jgi:purine nucleosidase
MHQPATPIPVVMDCDTGVDDALALLYLAASPAAELVAIGSVWGNTPADTAAANSLRVLEVAGVTGVPVCVGARGPLVGAADFSGMVHGTDGLGNTALPAPAGRVAPGSAAEQLVRLARERPGELTVIATGPLTNLALALLLEPRLPELVRGVAVMGGAFEAPGNATPLAEANIWHDPEAAVHVFAAPWPITLASLDVTMPVRVTAEQLGSLRGRTKAADFAWAVTQYYFDFYETRLPERSMPIHDMLTAALVVEPGLATYRQATVHVETAGEASRGMTYEDRRSWVPRGGNVAIAGAVAPDALWERLQPTLLALP